MFISAVAISKHLEPIFRGLHKPQQNVSCSHIELIVWWSKKSIWLVYAQVADRVALKPIVLFIFFFFNLGPSENGLRKQEDLWKKTINSDCHGFPGYYTGRSGLQLQLKYWREPGADFLAGQ